MSDSDLDFIDENDDFIEIFDITARHIQNIYQEISSKDLLKLYALYKQATIGNCNISKPSVFNVQACAKWTAWHNLANMSTKEAMEKYVEKAREVDPTWYPGINGESKKKFTINWAVHSVELNDEEPKAEHEKTIFDFVREGNIEQVSKQLKNFDMDTLDDNGMAIIHWAADGNNIEVLKLILSAGCPVDLRDMEKQTALHYAASCAHIESARVLLQHGANKLAEDMNGQTCLDVADDMHMRYILRS